MSPDACLPAELRSHDRTIIPTSAGMSTASILCVVDGGETSDLPIASTSDTL